MSQDAIATQLNNEGVLAPMEYKQSTGSGYQTGFYRMKIGMEFSHGPQDS